MNRNINFCYLKADGTMKIAHQITKSASIEKKTSALNPYYTLLSLQFP